MNEATRHRMELRQGGYCPIPAIGKVPVLKDWQKHSVTNAGEIELWEKIHARALNTSILTAPNPTIDIDILNEEAAEELEALAREYFEERGYILVRIGRHPKRAIVLRTDQPFPKIQHILNSPGGAEEKIEILCDGQQVVVFGMHPDTGFPYLWHGGEPGAIACEDLPYARQDELIGFADQAVRILVDRYGYQLKGARPKTNGQDGSASHHADWSWLLGNIVSGQALHDCSVALAAKLVSSGMSDGASVNLMRGVFEASALRDERWQERYDDIPRSVASARRKYAGENQAKFEPRPEPVGLPYISTSNWDNVPVPELEWAVLNRVPRRQVAIFSGEGAMGKSTISLQLCAAHALGRDWLGTMPEMGPALFVDAEDDEVVIHRRLAAVVKHYGARFADLGGLHLVSLAGADAVLGAVPSKSGRVEPTALYGRLLQACGDIKPMMICLASVANFFAGNENDRSQVQQFVAMVTRLAIAANGSVLLISHPSNTGISSGSGISGSTQWHNSVRARFFLHGVKAGEDGQANSDQREIEFMKNNYGPMADRMTLRWKDGLFLPEGKPSTFEAAARNAADEDIFMKLMARFGEQNRTVGPNKGSNYAPAQFSDQPEARGLNHTRLKAAMDRLIDAGRVAIETFGPPSHERRRLIVRRG